ncbi:toll-like receptor 2 type-1 isoform X1 [Erpetoichthys calabaricus]|uniref:toll-like receptor 2 type-1 isoform X1 n=1 Tax=Erpetoichthys calabaricus TaxID=27687 RepID=UPI00223400A6|nr:toll-like receptor 2 type-1 isoform X1 [Erpetoichthys calabaricus]
MRSVMKICFFGMACFLVCFKVSSTQWSCSLEGSTNYCRCTMEGNGMSNIMACATASSFEIIGNAQDEIPLDFRTFMINLNSTARIKMTLKNVAISDDFIQVIFNSSLLGSLEEFVIEDSDYAGRGYVNVQTYNREIALRTFTIINLTISEFYDFYSLDYLKGFLAPLVNVSLIRCSLFLIPCEVGIEMLNLTYLDLSENKLQDTALTVSLCAEGYPELMVLKLRKNYLRSYATVCQTLRLFSKLIHLDLSQHDFSDPPPFQCLWQQSFKVFNISNANLQNTEKYLPEKVEILDLSKNRLSTFDVYLPRLKELYISNNKLMTLPLAHNFPGLEVFNIEGNFLRSLQKSDVQDFKNLKFLKAGGNSYDCVCTLVSKVEEIKDIIVQDWPDDYFCGSPLQYQRKRVKDVHQSVLECYQNIMLSVIIIGTLVILVILIVVCYKSHAFWYLRMAWKWLQAKRKATKEVDTSKIKYDAFISYSEEDCQWVEEILVPQLEDDKEHFKLCLHKRNFQPGKWIMDNVIESIEVSRKTLFIISKHFVNSEWCKYELEFSQRRFFDESNDFVILVLLEPIPKEVIPRRFCKLHKLMNKKTYLEWPEEEEEQGLFWDKLRTALKS